MPCPPPPPPPDPLLMEGRTESSASLRMSLDQTPHHPRSTWIKPTITHHRLGSNSIIDLDQTPQSTWIKLHNRLGSNPTITHQRPHHKTRLSPTTDLDEYQSLPRRQTSYPVRWMAIAAAYPCCTTSFEAEIPITEDCRTHWIRTPTLISVSR